MSNSIPYNPTGTIPITYGIHYLNKTVKTPYTTVKNLYKCMTFSGITVLEMWADMLNFVEPPSQNKEWSSARWLNSIPAVRTRLELATPGVTGRYSKPTELPHQSFQ